MERTQTLGFTVHESFFSREHSDGTITRLSVPSGMTAPNAVAVLERELPAEHFHLNYLYRIYHPAIDDKAREKKIEQYSPNAAPCLNDRCYGRQAIQWKDYFAQCTRKMKIGVIDTFVDTRHKAFTGQEIHEETFVPDGQQLAESGHGTGVLALLAGRPDSDTPGLVSESAFYVASIFFAGDDGGIQTDTLSLLRALEWLKDSAVQLVNMSFSGPQDNLVEARLRKLRAKGMVFAAAAGNEGLAADPSYPAAYPQVIAVTAVDKKLHVYPSANRGDYIDVAAPGVHIWTALPNSREGYLSGTSFAVPFMTAMLAIQRQETLHLLKDELLSQMKITPLEAGGQNRTFGRGLLHAPSECPNAPEIATGWAPVAEVSLR
ncbi:MAG TPA: S8 family serine peptidase [Hyphomicrobiales bacterium]|nr:S8 family serine peptidase [Hyphomicrobiales bacterium]